jgi:hypothetical protein
MRVNQCEVEGTEIRLSQAWEYLALKKSREWVISDSRLSQGVEYVILTRFRE